MDYRNQFGYLTTVSAILWMSLTVPALAQSIVPATDGTDTQLTVNGPQLNITGGTQTGANLFHSFQQFGLESGQIANFLATPDLQNILGRVTGGSPSVINGLLQVTGGSPNLYLMNPSGIIFGPNASLNVPASFTATTATGIGFGTSNGFNANGVNSYADLIGNPTSFSFALSQPGAIVNSGDLAVNPGQSLNLIGSTVINTGTVTAPGGNITLTAVPGSSLVRLSQPGSLLSLEIDRVALSGAEANNPPFPTPSTLPQLLTGSGLTAQATGLTVEPDGTVRLAATQTLIPQEAGTTIVAGLVDVSSPTSQLSNSSPSQAGTVQILGDRVGLFSANVNASGVNGGGTVLIGGEFQGKGPLPNAQVTIVDATTTIQANALNTGNGGRVIIWADGTTHFGGTIGAKGGALSGDGGFVEVSGKENLLFQGHVDTSATNGTTGTLLLDPVNITIDTVGATYFGPFDFSFTQDSALSYTIASGTLTTQQSSIRLEASNNITIAPGVQLSFLPIVPPNPPTATVAFIADADGDGVGSFSMDTTRTIDTNLRSLSISGESITLGTIRTSSGNQSFTANQITFVSVQGPGSTLFGTTITLQPRTANHNVEIGGTGNTTTLGLTTATLQAIQPGFSRILIGRPDSTGTVTINAVPATNAPITIQGAGTLVAANQTNTFTLTGANQGDVNGLNFINVGGLQGGTVNDTFSVSNGVPFAGTIDGGAGNDTLSYSAFTSAVTIDLATLGASNIETIVGTTSAIATLKGPNGDNTFILTGANQGSLGSISFRDIRGLQGGSLNDTVQFNGGSIANLNGGAGNLILQGDLSGVTGPVAGMGELILQPTTTLPSSLFTLLQDGFSTIRFGNTSQATTLTGNITVLDPLVIEGDTIDTSGATLQGTGNASLFLAATQSLTTGNLSTQGQFITFVSNNGAITTGDLTTQGGNVTLQAATTITTGNLNTSATTGNGGNVLLDPPGLTQVGFINTQASNGTGGNVSVNTNLTIANSGLFRATGSFTALDGTLASISTQGTTPGSITIQHNGGSTTPFTVGDSSTNGTAAALTSGGDRLAPTQSFSTSLTQGSGAGQIQLITTGSSTTPPVTPSPAPVMPSPEPATPSPDLNAEDSIGSQERPNQGTSNAPAPDLTDQGNLLIQTGDLAQSQALVNGMETSQTQAFANYLELDTVPESDSLVDGQTMLTRIEQAVGVKGSLVYVTFQPATITANQPAQTSGEKQIPKREEHLSLVLVTAEGKPVFISLPQATRSKITTLATRLRRQVANPNEVDNQNYLTAAQQLYTLILQPLAAELEKRKIDHISFILDEGLRILPLGVLHDGKQFLAERYSLGLMPSLSLTDTEYRSVKTLQVLAAGSAAFTDNPPLPTVPIEVKTIVDRIWSGKSLLNQALTVNNLRSERQARPFGIIHLATHGEFRPGTIDNSYIEMGDRRLRLNEIRTLGWNNPPVELLVLSACRTAFGSPDVELGFAGFAVKAGVKSAIASLWYVSDEGTTGLMLEFYQQLRAAPTKAQALQAAQKAMIQGKVFVKGGKFHWSGGQVDLPPELADMTDHDLSHPYYWSAFSLIGNPW